LTTLEYKTSLRSCRKDQLSTLFFTHTNTHQFCKILY
jgi:hypothetical protein